MQLTSNQEILGSNPSETTERPKQVYNCLCTSYGSIIIVGTDLVFSVVHGGLMCTKLKINNRRIA